MTQSTYSVPGGAQSIQRLAAVVGVAGLALCALGYTQSHEHFYRAYLIAWVFWLGVALGSLAWLMIQHLSGGAWGVVTRRVYEASSRTLPLMGLLFVPVWFGASELYIWARPEAASDPIIAHKAAYLNVTGFTIRAVFYFVAWSAMAWALSSWSRRQDASDDPALARRMQKMSGGGLVFYAVTIFFASIDWMMSVDPHWFSTIYGILFMGGQGLSSMAFTIAVIVLLARTEPMKSVIGPGHLHDLGKLLLAFVMLWAYFNFSQFLIIWSGNLPEEIPWYLTRLTGGWEWVSLALLVGHFALPFLLLLNRDLKRSGATLATIAAIVIVMRLIDLFWLLGPGHGEALVKVHWLDAVAPVALGGVFVAAFLRELGRRPLLPLGEPDLHDAIARGHGH